MKFFNEAKAHGGGLDQSGGHNCYVGSCAGSYHYHRSSGGKSSGDFLSDNFGLLLFLIFVVAVVVNINKSNKVQDKNNNKETSNRNFKVDNSQHGESEKISENYLPSQTEQYEWFKENGPLLIDLIQEAKTYKKICELSEMMERCIYLQTNYEEGCRYFKTQNNTIDEGRSESSLLWRGIELYLIKKDGVFVSAEMIKGGFSNGFMHPKLLKPKDGKLYEITSSGSYQIADTYQTLTFEEFSADWSARIEKDELFPQWSTWLRNRSANDRVPF